MKQILLSLAIIFSFSALSAQNVGQEGGDSLVNYKDINGFKQGYWKKVNVNGYPVYEGYFIDDKPVGKFKRFDEKGTTTADLYYHKTGDKVNAIFYHPNGKKAAVGNYVNQKKDSIWLYYNEQGRMVVHEGFKNGLRHGKFSQYTYEGVLFEDIAYENGLKHGPYLKFYYDTGRKMSESTYRNDTLQGKSTSYYKNGRVYIEGTFVNGLKEGGWLKYKDNGSLDKLYQYKKGACPEFDNEQDTQLKQWEKMRHQIPEPLNANDIDWLRGRNGDGY